MAVPVAGISNATAISAGDRFACALLADGTVSCWGDDGGFQLGNTDGTFSTTPVPVAGLTGATMISATSAFVCALVSGGTVRCWGEAAMSVVQDGGEGLSAMPMTVPGLSGVTSISTSGGLCAIVSGGVVECWPFGATKPNIITGVTATAVSGNCALTPGGQITCWDAYDDTLLPDAGPIGHGGFTSLSNDGYSGCGVEPPGAVCWGNNQSGQLGGGVISETGPVDVSGVSGVAAIAIGGSDIGVACAVMNDGTVRCWGDDQYGESGDGTIGSGGPSTVLVPLSNDRG